MTREKLLIGGYSRTAGLRELYGRRTAVVGGCLFLLAIP